MLTMWIVMALVVIVALLLMTRGRAMVPGKAQNAIECVYELLEDFASSLGGPQAEPLHPAVRRASSCSSCSRTGAA